MKSKIIFRIKNILVLGMLLALGGCVAINHALMHPNLIACSSDMTAEHTLDDGSRYVGEFWCDKANGAGYARGAGTLYKPDGSVIKASHWFTDYNNASSIRFYGDIERRWQSGQILRLYGLHIDYYGRPYFDVPANDGTGLISGSAVVSYSIFPDGIDQWHVQVNGKSAMINLGPIAVKKRKVSCGGVPDGYIMTAGSCKAGKPDGKVFFHKPNGLEKLWLNYVDGHPVGLMRYHKIELDISEESYPPKKPPLFPSIATSSAPYQRDGASYWKKESLELKAIYIASGTPKVVKNAKENSLEFEKLEKYGAYSPIKSDYFSGGFTTRLAPNGNGQCETNVYENWADWKISKRRSDLSVALEACSYSGTAVAGGYMSRVDSTDEKRYSALLKSIEKSKREGDERFAEHQRAREEKARQDAEEDRQIQRMAARNPVGLNSIASDMAKLDAASRGTTVEAERAAARRRAEFNAIVDRQKGSSSSSGGPTGNADNSGRSGASVGQSRTSGTGGPVLTLTSHDSESEEDRKRYERGVAEAKAMSDAADAASKAAQTKESQDAREREEKWKREHPINCHSNDPGGCNVAR